MFTKIRFYSTRHNAATVGLVLPVDRAKTITVTELSRMFPLSCAGIMEHCETNGNHPCWETAFECDDWPSGIKTSEYI